MSKIEELLRQKREAQIRRMEGNPDADSEAEVDRALKEVSKKSRKRTPKSKKVKSKSLKFSPHAYRRMSQRGMSAKDVYTIWRAGEFYTQADGRTAYTVTRGAIDVALAEDRAQLEQWLGCAIIVEERTHNPMLITILASGEDTKTYSAWRKRPNRRRQR